jgi:hypothetical protein
VSLLEGEHGLGTPRDEAMCTHPLGADVTNGACNMPAKHCRYREFTSYDMLCITWENLALTKRKRG